jgi:hypothetical protein
MQRVSWGDSGAIIDALRTCGFCCVTGLESLQHNAELVVTKTTCFLRELNVDDASKYSWGRLGVQRSERKQGVRVLTGLGRLKQATNTPLPSLVGDDLHALGEALNNLMVHSLVRRLSNVVGNCEKLRQAGVCLFRNQDRDLREFGMLDVVSYDGPFSMEAHKDPGLFSLSLWSSCEGLEFQLPTTNEWVRPESNAVILWCGLCAEKVSDGELRAAVHRVVMPTEGTRSTIWHEACISSQIPFNIPKARLSTENLLLLTFSIKSLTGKLDVFEKAVTVNHYVEDVYNLYQDRAGMPPAKTRLIYKGALFESYYETLGSMGVEDGAIFHSVLSLRRESRSK